MGVVWNAAKIAEALAMSIEERDLQMDIPSLLDKAGKVFMEAPSVYLAGGMVFFAAAAALGVFSVALSFIPFIGWLLQMVLALASWALFGALFVGILGMTRKAVGGERPRFEDLFSAFGPALLPAASASALIGVMCAIGAPLVVPGLAIAAIYLHTWLFLGEGERDFWAAMESSRKLVFDNLKPWLLVFAIVFCIGVAGASVCGIGLIPAIPFAALFLAAAYEAAGVPGGAAENEAPASELPPRSD